MLEGSITQDVDEVVNAKEKYVSPDFIDIHIHGGGESTFMDGTVEDFLKVAETHSQFWNTSTVPTILTSEKENLLNTLNTYRKAFPLNTCGVQFLRIRLGGLFHTMNQKRGYESHYIRKLDKEKSSPVMKV